MQPSPGEASRPRIFVVLLIPTVSAAIRHRGDSRWDRSVLLDALQDDPARRVGTTLRNIQIAERDQSGRVVRAVVEGNEASADVRGEELRRVISGRFGANSVKSTRFSVQLDGDRIVFEGRGLATASVSASGVPSNG